jgi:hypothetical protein
MQQGHKPERWQPAYNEFACDCAICQPELWAPTARGRLMSGLSVVGDYPSLLEPPHFAPDVLLLDTCVIQQLEWVRTRAPTLNDDVGWGSVRRLYGSVMAQELKALVGLRGPVEQVSEQPRAWVVGRSSWEELSRAPSHRRTRLLEEWRFWRERATCFQMTWTLSHGHCFPLFLRRTDGRARAKTPFPGWTAKSLMLACSVRFATAEMSSSSTRRSHWACPGS